MGDPFADYNMKNGASFWCGCRRGHPQHSRIFSHSLDLLCVASLDGKFKRLNPAWEKTLGYELGELKGMRIIDLVHPDDIKATHKAIAELSTGKTIIDFMNRCRCKDGSHLYLEWRSRPYQKSLIYSVVRDITERKQSEENLQHLSEVWRLSQEMANIGNWSFNIKTQQTIWSDQMFVILGCDPQNGLKIFLKILQRLSSATPFVRSAQIDIIPI